MRASCDVDPNNRPDDIAHNSECEIKLFMLKNRNSGAARISGEYKKSLLSFIFVMDSNILPTFEEKRYFFVLPLPALRTVDRQCGEVKYGEVTRGTI